LPFSHGSLQKVEALFFVYLPPFLDKYIADDSHVAKLFLKIIPVFPRSYSGTDHFGLLFLLMQAVEYKTNSTVQTRSRLSYIQLQINATEG